MSSALLYVGYHSTNYHIMIAVAVNSKPHALICFGYHTISCDTIRVFLPALSETRKPESQTTQQATEPTMWEAPDILHRNLPPSTRWFESDTTIAPGHRWSESLPPCHAILPCSIGSVHSYDILVHAVLIVE